ncbi:MAG: hypothetical protein RSC08_07455, partial [Oscillospiraceae bacterium]
KARELSLAFPATRIDILYSNECSGESQRILDSIPCWAVQYSIRKTTNGTGQKGERYGSRA